MTINMDEIEKALGEATEGPWEVGYDEHSPSKDGLFWWIHCPKGSLGYMPKPDVDDDNYVRFTKEDAHLIAHAPEWLRLLVELVRKLEKVAEAAGGVASSVLVAKEHSKHRQMAEYISCMNEATGPEMDALIKALIVANVPGWEE